ncbi:CHASE2 domain-containing protein [Melaminivora sp.]|uniref:CHASE2 domain-containing protein n=1 Tax=Melaminivora sp. TaxID=1933032 RepID=UPI0028AA84C7|nr:CHASE2 domain-containing protein [Melaminivora sp.]
MRNGAGLVGLRAAPWAVLLVAALLAAWLATLAGPRGADGQIHDLLTRLPAPAATAEDDGVVLIDIDERSLQELGPWPWPRSVLADLSLRLREQGAALQVWDLFFAHDTPADAQLARAFARSDAVIGIVPVLDPAVAHPPEEGAIGTRLHAPAWCSGHAQVRGYLGVAEALAGLRAGHLAATPDADGRLRRVPAVVCLPRPDGQAPVRIPQLALAAAAAAQPDAPWQLQDGRWPWQPAQWLQRGSWRFALDGEGYLPVPYLRPHTGWPAISASRLLQGDAPLPLLRGRTVLVGATALGARDLVSTPYHPGAPGVSVHAELLQAASGATGWGAQPVRAPALMAALVALLAGAALVPLARPGRPLSSLVGGLLLCMLAPVALAWAARQWLPAQLPVAAPVLSLAMAALAILGLQLLAQRRQMQALAEHLQSFLPAGLAQQIATRQPPGQSLGQPHTGALAATRIDGLARWVGRVDSLQALALIHAMHTTAQQTAREHGGRLEYVQGDTLYMSWPEAQASAQALACLRQLHRRLEPLLQRNAGEATPLLAYSALESGSYLLGIVGGPDGRRGVLLGPAVNEITGILDLSPELDGPILVGPQAARALHAAGGASGAALQPLGQFLLFEQPGARQLFRADA